MASRFYYFGISFWFLRLRATAYGAVAQFLVVRPLTHHTFMNTKYKAWFEETAADPVRRRAAIADFTKQRALLICCALVASAAAAFMFFTSTRSPNSPALLTFSAAMIWIGVVRVDARRQALTLIDKLFSRDEKPAV